MIRKSEKPKEIRWLSIVFSHNVNIVHLGFKKMNINSGVLL